MSLAKKISDDVKSALKGGDKKKLSIARYVYSELKNFLIKENLERDVLKLSDENIIKIVKTQLKQKKESLDFAKKAIDQEKVDGLEFDINYLNSLGLNNKIYVNCCGPLLRYIASTQNDKIHHLKKPHLLLLLFYENFFHY